jgi:hypothetical protein
MLNSRKKLRRLAIMPGIVVSTLFLLSSNAMAQQVYSNDFSGGAGAEWSSNATAMANGEVFLAEGNEGSGPGTNTLTLTNLPSHDSVTVSFDLYIIESWDGNAEFCCGPDTWQLSADGSLVFISNFANYTDGGNQTQAYPAEIAPNGPGATNPPGTGASAEGHLGFPPGDFTDRTYSLSFTIPHSADTVSLAFTGGEDQAPGDEGWGLDNVVVTVATSAPVVDAAPVPMTNPLALALIVILLGTVGFVALRSRS